jgi:hypothetical protein
MTSMGSWNVGTKTSTLAPSGTGPGRRSVVPHDWNTVNSASSVPITSAAKNSPDRIGASMLKTVTRQPR